MELEAAALGTTTTLAPPARPDLATERPGRRRVKLTPQRRSKTRIRRPVKCFVGRVPSGRRKGPDGNVAAPTILYPFRDHRRPPQLHLGKLEMVGHYAPHEPRELSRDRGGDNTRLLREGQGEEPAADLELRARRTPHPPSRSGRPTSRRSSTRSRPGPMGTVSRFVFWDDELSRRTAPLRTPPPWVGQRRRWSWERITASMDRGRAIAARTEQTPAPEGNGHDHRTPRSEQDAPHPHTLQVEQVTECRCDAHRSLTSGLDGRHAEPYGRGLCASRTHRRKIGKDGLAR